ncbi:PIN domain-containing protein [Sphingomonas oryzagri]
MYLLDTNVVSESRKLATGRADPKVVAWMSATDPALTHLSAITLFELEHGVLLMERRDPIQGAMLRRWLIETVRPAFEGRILPMSAEVASQCARLHVPDPRSERDSWIAATALVHDMTVVTRNVDDFAGTGVSLINPWDAPSVPGSQ